MDDEQLTRRDAMRLLAASAAAAGVGCSPASHESGPRSAAEAPMKTGNPGATESTADPLLDSGPLGFQWPVRDPFLFCVHHDDHYPQGTPEYGPAAQHLRGRQLGQDFEVRDGFRMYHGRVVPGFPRHPHRGFETVTVVRRGLLDHADSMGAAARYGGGDVQWLTAGAGIQHAEMFPLLRADADNPLELFQIWLNLPSSHKMVAPHFSMLWHEKIPRVTLKDDAGRQSELTIIAGGHGDRPALSPPPSSWASQPGSDVAIWTLKLAPGARFTLPAAPAGSHRMLYAFLGESLSVGPTTHALAGGGRYFELRPELPVTLENGAQEAELLMLQGRPIGEPVARHGPFVMNTTDELRRAYHDYQRTAFGGWPWERNDPVHGETLERFARHADGSEDRPT